MIFLGNCDGYCVPFIVYLVLAGLTIFGQIAGYFLVKDKSDENPPMTTNQKIRDILGTVISSAIFAFILYALCTHCYNKASWFLLLFPFIFAVLMMITAIGFGSMVKK